LKYRFTKLEPPKWSRRFNIIRAKMLGECARLPLSEFAVSKCRSHWTRMIWWLAGLPPC